MVLFGFVWFIDDNVANQAFIFTAALLLFLTEFVPQTLVPLTVAPLTFVPLDICPTRHLSHLTFVPLGHFSHWDFCPTGHIPTGKFVPLMHFSYWVICPTEAVYRSDLI